MARKIKIKETIDMFLASLDARPVSKDSYRRKLGYFFVFIFKQGARQPDKKELVAYKDNLERSGLTASTIQSYLQPVKMFFKWAEKNKIYQDIASEIKSVKISKEHKKDCLTAGQVKKILEGIDRSTISGKRDYALFSLMVVTGIREISASLANVCDIRSSGDGKILLYQGKGKIEKANYVKITDPVWEAVYDYLQAREEPAGAEPLFASHAIRNRGGRMTTRSISRIIKSHMLAAGLDSDRLSGHSLRHTAATLNLLSGGSLEETRQLLGHSNINTTMIYRHDIERFNNMSEDRISRSIFER